MALENQIPTIDETPTQVIHVVKKNIGEFRLSLIKLNREQKTATINQLKSAIFKKFMNRNTNTNIDDCIIGVRTIYDHKNQGYISGTGNTNAKSLDFYSFYFNEDLERWNNYVSNLKDSKDLKFKVESSTSKNPYLFKKLNTRTSFFNQAIQIISENPKTIRIMLNGPVCFHPDWLYLIRDKKESRKSFSKELKKFILSIHSGKKDIRIIFFNSQRYIQGLNKYLTNSTVGKFKKEIIQEISKIVEQDKYGSLKFCSVNTGFFQVIFVTNKYCLETSSKKEYQPVSSGMQQTNTDYISLQIDKFDRIFDYEYKGITEEINILKNFINEIDLNQKNE